MPTIGRETTITWLGHGTFHITTPQGKRLLIDPWVDTNPACPEEWKARVKHEGLDAIFITHGHFDHIADLLTLATLTDAKRSEERRVGKECRSRWSQYHYKHRLKW